MVATKIWREYWLEGGAGMPEYEAEPKKLDISLEDCGSLLTENVYMETNQAVPSDG